MTPERSADAMTDFAMSRVFDAMDEYGASLAEEFRDIVSVPVEYRGDGTVIRSLPGEPPRKEFGDYQRSFTHRTYVRGRTVVTEAGSVMPRRGRKLEFGEGYVKPRPHFIRMFEVARFEAADRVKQNL